jgi:co-chaperonin GroES (HSP10)
MKAIGKYIIIDPDKIKHETTSSGFILNEKNKESIRYKDATIISVGELIGDKLVSGDRVKYDRHAGHSLDDKYLVIKLEDIAVKL